MLFTILQSLLLLAPLAAAHGAVTSYIIGGKTYPGYQGFSPAQSPPSIQRQWPNYNPVMSVASTAMTCNGGTSAQLSAPLVAGQNITAVWGQWTHQQGPLMVWMYKCAGEFSSCTGAGKNWFKINQMGMFAPPLTGTSWGTALIYKTLKWEIPTPAELPSGYYLIRHELLAIHQSNTPQFYPECAQLNITGRGAGTLPPAAYMYSIPAYTTQNDPSTNVR